jgi:hypothetical protein
MATITNSCMVRAAAQNSEHLIDIGKQNPIPLPDLMMSDFRPTLGEKIGRGDVGQIFKVKGSNPPKVYKIIPIKNFKDGNEIRISMIAGTTGISPVFHGAFVVEGQFIVIEMDQVGKSLNRWRIDLASDAASDLDPILEAEKQAFKELQEKAEDFAAVIIKQPKKLSFEAAVEKLYETEEAFYFKLFSKIKGLAERNIAFLDTNLGNIIPNIEKGGDLMLLDFDCAQLTERTSQAAEQVLCGNYTSPLLKTFSEIAKKPESQELISWFKKQALEEILFSFRKMA